MSYLNLSQGIPNFSKAVISLWFRVPQVSIDSATAAFSGDYQDAPPLFNGIIPLVVMGPKGFLNPSTTVVTHIVFDSGASYDLFTTTLTGASLPTNPLIIGINCDPGYGRPVLYINLETNQKADVSDYQFELRNVEEPATFTYVDVTDVVTNFTASINGTNIYLDPSGSGADKWHHLLISLDLPPIRTHGRAVDEEYTVEADYVDSPARLFVALDDVNYTEFDLSNFFVNHSEDHNAVIPELASRVAGAEQATGLSSDFPNRVILGGISQYTLSDPNIPCQEQPMGLPAPTEFVDNVYRVEMAEFQMWTGVMLDTGVTSNRRAFVGADGKPVEPIGTADDPRAPADKLLGKKPEILLHGSNDWIAGYNTGTTGVRIEIIDGKETAIKLPSGQFKPVAGIEAWKPDPSLEETTV